MFRRDNVVEWGCYYVRWLYPLLGALGLFAVSQGAVSPILAAVIQVLFGVMVFAIGHRLINDVDIVALPVCLASAQYIGLENVNRTTTDSLLLICLATVMFLGSSVYWYVIISGVNRSIRIREILDPDLKVVQ